MRGVTESKPLTFAKAREVEETFAEWVRRVRTIKGAQDLMLEGLAGWRDEFDEMKAEVNRLAVEQAVVVAVCEAAVEKLVTAAGTLEAKGVELDLDPAFREALAMATAKGEPPKKKRGRPKKEKPETEPEESGDD